MSSDEPKKHNHVHLGALIIVILLISILFRVNIEKAINSPQFQSNVEYIEKEAIIIFNKIKNLFHIENPFTEEFFEKKVQPEKIQDYFRVPTDERVNQISSPTGN